MAFGNHHHSRKLRAWDPSIPNLLGKNSLGPNIILYPRLRENCPGGLFFGGIPPWWIWDGCLTVWAHLAFNLDLGLYFFLDQKGIGLGTPPSRGIRALEPSNQIIGKFLVLTILFLFNPQGLKGKNWRNSKGRDSQYWWVKLT